MNEKELEEVDLIAVALKHLLFIFSKIHFKEIKDVYDLGMAMIFLILTFQNYSYVLSPFIY